MKTIIFFIIMFAIGVAACTHQTQTTVNNQSWAAYCEAYNVDLENPTVEQTDFYMDCWVGSVAEEKALNQ